MMATLTVRNLDEGMKARLRIRAAEHGRSMEAEVREILAAALAAQDPPRGLGSRIARRFSDVDGPWLDLPPRAEPARAVEFDE